MLKVAAYCRVSTDNEDQLNSLESQIKYFTSYITDHEDWTLKKIYADEGITGTSTVKRIQFNNMISDALSGQIDLIITKEVSRFARNTVDTLSYTRKLSAINVGVLFISDNIDTRDKDGEFRLTIMASVAQEESRKTSERVKWGMKRMMERGYVFVNTVYGYDVENGALKVNEEEAEIIRIIFHKFVNEGKGAMTIAKEMIDYRVPSNKRMKRWSATSVTRILKNEKYCGDLVQKKTYTPNYLEHKSVKNNGHEDKVVTENHHQPIIDRDLWIRSQQEWAKRSSMIGDRKRYSNVYWCSGKLVCGECGSSCVIRSKRLADGSKFKAWRCKEASYFGEPKIDGNENKIGCLNKQINEKALNTCMQFAVSHLGLNRQSIVQQLREDIGSLQNGNLNKDHQKKIQTMIDNLQRKKESLIDLHLEGSITKDEMLNMKAKYENELSDLTMKMQSILNSTKKLDETNQYLNQVFNKINLIVEQESTTSELYKQIVDRIVLYQGNELEVFIKHLPMPIRVRYQSGGRGSRYQTICELA